METPVVTYQIDRHGRIVSVGPGWDRFAHSNHGAHLTGNAVIGRTLWDFIGDPTTRTLYQTMVGRLLSGLPAITFAFRCDAPDERRLLEMRMRALPDDRVEFQVTPTTTVDRTPIPLLDPTVARSGDLLRMCSWCKRVPVAAEEWVEVEVAVQRIGWRQLQEMPAITHGICPTCEAEVFGLVEGPAPPDGHAVEFGAFT